MDGLPARVFPATGIQRAVLVPPGSSHVDLSYWPQGQTVGFSIRATALGGFVALVPPRNLEALIPYSCRDPASPASLGFGSV